MSTQRTIITNALRVGKDIKAALTASEELSAAVGARIWPILYDSDGDPEYPYITYGRNAFNVEKDKDGSRAPVGVGVTIDVNARTYGEIPELCDLVHLAVTAYIASGASPIRDYKLQVGEDQYIDGDHCHCVSLTYTFDIS